MSGIVKSVGKVFRKIVQSPIFKVVAIAAAVYFTGGLAAGAFGTMAAGAEGAALASSAVLEAGAAGAVEAGVEGAMISAETAGSLAAAASGTVSSAGAIASDALASGVTGSVQAGLEGATAGATGITGDVAGAAANVADAGVNAASNVLEGGYPESGVVQSGLGTPGSNAADAASVANASPNPGNIGDQVLGSNGQAASDQVANSTVGGGPGSQSWVDNATDAFKRNYYSLSEGAQKVIGEDGFFTKKMIGQGLFDAGKAVVGGIAQQEQLKQQQAQFNTLRSDQQRRGYVPNFTGVYRTPGVIASALSAPPPKG